MVDYELVIKKKKSLSFWTRNIRCFNNDFSKETELGFYKR